MPEKSFPVVFNEWQQRRLDHERQAEKRDPHVIQQPKYGRIVRSMTVVDENTGKYSMYVHVRFDDIQSDVLQGSFERPFVLGHTATEIAALYGDDLVNMPCRVEYFGHRRNQGIVFIVNRDGSGNLENAHKLPAFGTVLAPPGAS